MEGDMMNVKRLVNRCGDCVHFTEGAHYGNSSGCTITQRLLKGDATACTHYVAKVKRHKAHAYRVKDTGHSLDRFCYLCTHFEAAAGEKKLGTCHLFEAEALRQDHACDKFNRNKNAQRPRKRND